MKIAAVAFFSALIGALLSVGLLVSIDEVWAQRARKTIETKPAGVIPTEFGEFVFASGDINTRVLFFQDADKRITWVLLRGNAVPKIAYQVERSTPDEIKESEDSKKKRTADRGSKDKFQTVSAGEVPSEWGNLVSAYGDAVSVTLLFRDEEANLRYLVARNNKLPGLGFSLDRRYQ